MSFSARASAHTKKNNPVGSTTKSAQLLQHFELNFSMHGLAFAAFRIIIYTQKSRRIHCSDSAFCTRPRKKYDLKYISNFIGSYTRNCCTLSEHTVHSAHIDHSAVHRPWNAKRWTLDFKFKCYMIYGMSTHISFSGLFSTPLAIGLSILLNYCRVQCLTRWKKRKKPLENIFVCGIQLSVSHSISFNLIYLRWIGFHSIQCNSPRFRCVIDRHIGNISQYVSFTSVICFRVFFRINGFTLNSSKRAIQWI